LYDIPQALYARLLRLYTQRPPARKYGRRITLNKFRIQTWTLWGFLIAVLLAPYGSVLAAAQNKTTVNPEAPTHKYPRSARGDYDMADGQIKNVQCRGKAMEMVFDDSNEILHLYADSYFKVDFSAINFTPKGTMDPCKTTKGMYARVHFYHIKGHPRVGELTSVELRK
jgi:hypothetical protein